MIGVIADDLTGAAEIGAVGLRHGLRAEVVLAGDPSGGTDLVCMDTDSRLCVPGEAAARATRAARWLRQQRPEWVYKKTDSVLRGNVTPEIEAVLGELGLNGALLIPANPSLGRTIVGGQYFVRGQLIHETEFARDPTHPRLSPNVCELVTVPASLPLLVRRAEQGLPLGGMVIGEVVNAAELCQWAALRNARWLMAGGAEFFGALLTRPVLRSQPKPTEGRALFVCGSTCAGTRNFVARQAERGVPMFSLPQELATGASFEASRLTTLVGQVVAAFQAAPRVILHVGLPPVKEVAVAETLASHLVRVAEQVLLRATVSQVFAEGGTTAAALARQMGWHRLQVTAELAPGVVMLSTYGESCASFALKPGSYPWPQSVADFCPHWNR